MEPRDRGPVAAPPALRRIGIFGGSFDPIHAGHLHAARAARDAFHLDRVVFVPAFRSPFKAGIEPAPAADRLRMVELAIAGERGFEVSDLEIARGGPSYTVDTVRALPARLGERADVALHLIVGSDVLPGLGGWREARALLERVQPIVVHRAGDPAALFAALARDLGPDLARKVERGYLRLPPVEAASTDVRAALAGRGEVAVLPAAVARYAQERGLYGTRA